MSVNSHRGRTRCAGLCWLPRGKVWVARASVSSPSCSSPRVQVLPGPLCTALCFSGLRWPQCKKMWIFWLLLLRAGNAFVAGLEILGHFSPPFPTPSSPWDLIKDYFLTGSMCMSQVSEKLVWVGHRSLAMATGTTRWAGCLVAEGKAGLPPAFSLSHPGKLLLLWGAAVWKACCPGVEPGLWSYKRSSRPGRETNHWAPSPQPSSFCVRGTRVSIPR